jgi:uncharacterized membrane protein
LTPKYHYKSKDETIQNKDKERVKMKKSKERSSPFEFNIEHLATIRHSKNLNELQGETLSIGDQLADAVANIAGSWRFIISFVFILFIWIALNSTLLIVRPFDPYPFILLNLVLSCIAALQAPIIMMSQNRQEAKDRLRAEHDYEVNLKSEILIEEVLKRLSRLEANQQELMEYMSKIENKD